MAKGQKKGNREAKKPKATAKKPAAPAAASQYQLSVRNTPGKSSAK